MSIKNPEKVTTDREVLDGLGEALVTMRRWKRLKDADGHGNRNRTFATFMAAHFREACVDDRGDTLMDDPNIAYCALTAAIMVLLVEVFPPKAQGQREFVAKVLAGTEAENLPDEEVVQ